MDILFAALDEALQSSQFSTGQIAIIVFLNYLGLDYLEYYISHLREPARRLVGFLVAIVLTSIIVDFIYAGSVAHNAADIIVITVISWGLRFVPGMTQGLFKLTSNNKELPPPKIIDPDQNPKEDK